MSCTAPWHGRYALACDGLALLVLRRDNETRHELAHRDGPEAEGLMVGDEFLVAERDGRHEFTLVSRPRRMRFVEVDE